MTTWTAALTVAVAAMSFSVMQVPGAVAGETYSTQSTGTTAIRQTTTGSTSVSVNGGNTSSAPAPLDCSIESHPDCPRPGNHGRGNFQIQIGTSDMQNAE